SRWRRIDRLARSPPAGVCPRNRGPKRSRSRRGALSVVVSISGQRVNECLIACFLCTGRDGCGLAVGLVCEARRRHIRYPDLDGTQSLCAPALPMSANPILRTHADHVTCNEWGRTGVAPTVSRSMATMAAVSLTISTVNVNGIRAAVRQRSETNLGFLPWLESSGVDVVALQEVRANEDQARKALAPALEAGWHLVSAPSELKGRAGVALLSRHEPAEVQVGYGDPEFAESGRYIEATYPGAKDGETVTVASLYLPSGSADTPKQDEKDRFLATFREFLSERAADVAKRDGHEMIICGDWNIAHREEDLKNHKGNHKSSGFLPHEREWMTGVFAD